MKKKHIVSRRTAIITGVSSLGALLLHGCAKTTPPSYGNILRMGDAMTYNLQRALLPGQSMAKEYSRSDISSFPATGTTNPGDPNWQYHSPDFAELQRKSFEDWRLQIEGSVAKPGFYSMGDLQRFPSRTQITRHTCEEGWTAIAEWTGVQLSLVLQAAGIKTTARYVNFYSYDGYLESVDMLDALHPQTILAYGMNSRDLPLQHGAPLRVRIEKQIGYKSVKYLQKIVVSDDFIDNGWHKGFEGWSWYNGI